MTFGEFQVMKPRQGIRILWLLCQPTEAAVVTSRTGDYYRCGERESEKGPQLTLFPSTCCAHDPAKKIENQERQ